MKGSPRKQVVGKSRGLNADPSSDTWTGTRKTRRNATKAAMHESCHRRSMAALRRSANRQVNGRKAVRENRLLAVVSTSVACWPPVPDEAIEVKPLTEEKFADLKPFRVTNSNTKKERDVYAVDAESAITVAIQLRFAKTAIPLSVRALSVAD